MPGAVLYAALGAGLGNPVSPLFVGAAILVIALALVTRRLTRNQVDHGSGVGAGVKATESARPAEVGGDTALRRLAWSAAFFLTAVGALAGLTDVGLFH